ncbi:hypothetical protein B296_00026160 [Ensete ventricosum]|uniref:Uncharacterized protein n=1 Tax=Ensete ventricosum TaxID=4639 RepID=A0A426Z8I1_ENSVE|nr:hypothetical protein B296_00026160 [Ensete ventricosum]
MRPQQSTEDKARCPEAVVVKGPKARGPQSIEALSDRGGTIDRSSRVLSPQGAEGPPATSSRDNATRCGPSGGPEGFIHGAIPTRDSGKLGPSSVDGLTSRTMVPSDGVVGARRGMPRLGQVETPEK